MANKFYRSRTESMIAGVCGGLAEYFDLDATLIRIGAVILSFVGGYGILAYMICWVVIPQKPLAESVDDSNYEKQAEMIGDDPAPTKGGGAVFFGALLIVVGLLLVLDNFIPIMWLSFSKLWPIIVILVGIMILVKGTGKK